jgi:membrane protease YdiL (CAAX protease family)
MPTTQPEAAVSSDPPITQQRLLLAYLLPYFAYVGCAEIPAEWLGPAANYGLRLVLCTGLLAWGFRVYVPLRGPGRPLVSIAGGAVVGLAGTALWIALVEPFVPRDAEPWETGAWGMRLLASSLVVPVFEELVMRGLVLRAALGYEQAHAAGHKDALGEALTARSLGQIAPGAWSIGAIVVSTLAFTVGHASSEWMGAFAYGLLMCGLWIVRRDLLSCVVAHAVTNATLAIYIRDSGSWGLW